MTNTKNPLLQNWNTPFGLPPFGDIKPDHFQPAFEAAMAEHRREVDLVANDPAAPTFENSVEALERAGEGLSQVAGVFYNLSGAHTNEALQAVEREMAPVLSKHSMDMNFYPGLFERFDALMDERASLRLTPEQDRVLERYHTAFVRSGSKLDDTAKARLSEINQRLATIATQFSQNLLADEADYELVLEGEDDLAGLPDFLRAAAAQAAKDRGHESGHVITLSRSSIEPFLTFSSRRDLREAAFNAWIARGENGGATDNRDAIGEMVLLRAERAGLLGYDSFADFALDDRMAKTPAAVNTLLMQVWEPARARAEQEAALLQRAAQAEGENAPLAAWDWRYYAEKVRKSEHDLDEEEVKPYFQLDKMIEAAFDTANRLFGLTFKPLKDMPVYHPDVRAFEVSAADGRHIGIFLGDYFARPSKRSGAWASRFREQQKLRGDIRPLVVNVMNFSKGTEGEPTLMTFDDGRTLFHEFGHALHSMMSDVTYPRISGTSVATDFVELPSQLFEHWLMQPDVLSRFAVHYETGAPMPQDLIDRLLAARNFNQGWAAVEYTASAIVDMELHAKTDGDVDPAQVERDTLKRIGMPAAITPRHRLPHFGHLFMGDHYSAGYYSYLWSEVLDADAFNAFEEAGDAFDSDTAARLAEHIYAAGGRQDPGDAYRAFRGRDAKVEALLEKRGLVGNG